MKSVKILFVCYFFITFFSCNIVLPKVNEFTYTWCDQEEKMNHQNLFKNNIDTCQIEKYTVDGSNLDIEVYCNLNCVEELFYYKGEVLMKKDSLVLQIIRFKKIDGNLDAVCDDLCKVSFKLSGIKPGSFSKIYLVKPCI